MKLGTNSLTALRRKYRYVTRVTLFVILIICGFLLVYSLRPALETEVQPLPQDPAVKVYFNHNQSSLYEDPYRRFKRKGDNLEQQIIDAINQADSTLDLAVMEFRLPNVAKALIAQHLAGVKVRLLIDNKYNKALADYTPEVIAKMNQHDKSAFEELKRYPSDAMALLRESGIEIRDDTSGGATKGSGLMHHKFIVVDGKNTIITSANLTTSDLHGDFNSLESRGNPNNMVVVLDNTELAKAFKSEFNYMWQGLFKIHKPYRPPVTIPVGEGTITINFSPARRKQDIQTTSNGMIAFYIQQASSSVHIAVFVYSDQTISNTLGEVHDKGVEDIKVLIDPDFYRRVYSKAYDAMGVCPKPGKRKSKIQVKPWQNPITTVGFPIAPVGDRGVHSKMAILDGRLVITGSLNWSNSGNYLNDETLIAIDNPTVAAHYEREFNRLYGTAVVGLDSLPQSHQCGSDSSPSPKQPITSTESESIFSDN
ncbi:MAG: phosphatidylserine/phosphatidylglycerophosphate/cardiolipin synthase family protein [Symplocastrum torsivum CPER-KK1]|jgi:phosphatidylserine/phosphatidylglycerophosphate/cardiolipin synthase-like enzyme|uniref:phospholipase D n=1 Tax=Symplocastrum torsivum CPER-KK1 TaxID=450513 RepID=A0A951UCE7_9CYAN|nr:phosphatidylserine/phosphatidylglycerophosphate/cardiolipin synthase family protein [Symplocastrum torsivum CPER-KK1]